MMSGSRAVLDSQYAPFWGPNKFIFAKEHAYIGGGGMGRFRLPSVGTLEGRVRGDRDRALLTALLRADALSIGRVSSFPGCSATRPRLTRSLVHSATRKRKMSW